MSILISAGYRNFMIYKLLIVIFIILGWVTITFFGESVRFLVDKETNDTLTEPVPRLPLKAWYPFDAMSGTMYIIAFAFQASLFIFERYILNNKKIFKYVIGRMVFFNYNFPSLVIK